MATKPTRPKVQPSRPHDKSKPRTRKAGIDAGIKIRRISIRNYKGIDELDLAIDAPRMPGDPDILVIGSKNGVGKTSVLEVCGLLLLGALAPEMEKQFHARRLDKHLFDLMIRAGSQKAEIEGELEYKGERFSIGSVINKKGSIDSNPHTSSPLTKELSKSFLRSIDEEPLGFFMFLLGFESDPLLAPPLLYFHSYRKVMEGSPELRYLVDDYSARHMRYRRAPHRSDGFAGVFKAEVLKAMMGKAELFENMSTRASEEAQEKINELMKRFAGGTIEKLRPSEDNTIEFRVSPVGGGPSFSFDGLSSGQKEIISTLFMIWRYTRDEPGLVLIDEPELHLNAEWHREFIRGLTDLAPRNQYIIATHSEDVFASVEPDRRIMLTAPGAQ